MSTPINGAVKVVFADGFVHIAHLSDFGGNGKGATIDGLIATHGKIKEIVELLMF